MNKRIVRDIIVTAALATLIFVRFFVAAENCLWVNAINFAGFIVACTSLYTDVFSECKNMEKVNVLTGVSICLLIVLVIVEILVVLNIIKFSMLWNDIITLSVLLISLPSKLYTKIFVKILK